MYDMTNQIFSLDEAQKSIYAVHREAFCKEVLWKKM